MNLPNSAVLALGGIFYRIYRQTDDATNDAMAILKIFDFSWNPSTEILTYEKNGRSVELTKKMCLSRSPFEVIPVKNISSFDLDCLEKVLNTRMMVGLKSAEGLYPLFECIGWQIKKHGDTYRLHFVGGTDYWETDDYWKTDWKEPWNDEIQPLNNDTLRMVKLKYPNLPNWDLDNEIPKEWT